MGKDKKEGILNAAQQAFAMPPQQRVIPWFLAQGDKTLRLEYDLDQKSIVFDLGGYQGEWTANIFARYGCTIHVFEPVREYAAHIAERFASFDHIHVYSFGLGKKDEKAMLNVDKDSSSIFIEGDKKREITLVRANDFIQAAGISNIDLMKINIEGGEYDLLEHLIEMKVISFIKNIQVQFHDFVPNAVERMIHIQNELAKTHFITYQFPFVWENWRSNDTSPVTKQH
ncbi:MAG: FkbM family methyltransferase [Veillonellales bacterium]